MCPGNRFIDAVINQHEADVANIFTKYFQGRGIKNDKDNEESMADKPKDFESPYRAAEVTEPPKPKTRLVLYERSGEVPKAFLSGAILFSAFSWLFILAAAFCFREPFMRIVWMLNRPLIVILVMCLFWCIGYLRVKRVPVE